MSTQPDHHDANGDAFALPSRTTPTWEVEILLSGATVFALFQLYGIINANVIALLGEPHSDAGGAVSGLLVYTQAGVLALALGFMLHLALRAFWVGAVGLRSVDPEGRVRQSINIGPEQQRLVAQAWDRLPQHVARLDDWATLTFALSLGLSKLIVLLTLAAAVLNLLGYGVHRMSGGSVDLGMAMAMLALLMIGPMVLATMVDNRAGKRGRASPRWAARVLAPYSATGLLANQNLALQIFTQRASGNANRARGTLAVILLIFSLIVMVGLSMVWHAGRLGDSLGNPLLRAQVGQGATLRTNHFSTLQHPRRLQRAPYLPSEVVTGAYARLRIPFIDESHTDLLRDCARKNTTRGDAESWRFDGRGAAVLACVAATQLITLDGKPIRTPWFLVEDLKNGGIGFVVMIDVRDLPRGEHVLTIARPPAEAPDESDAPLRPWRIPFWT